MKIQNVFLILAIIFFIVIMLMIIYSFIDTFGDFDLYEYKDFCEAKGGERPVFGGDRDCLIEENGVIIEYQVIKFKGELRLQK